jgi:hypothetical protein
MIQFLKTARARSLASERENEEAIQFTVTNSCLLDLCEILLLLGSQLLVSLILLIADIKYKFQRSSYLYYANILPYYFYNSAFSFSRSGGKIYDGQVILGDKNRV